eukprot:2609953-Pleurochrysis_carterae.AAC.5
MCTRGSQQHKHPSQAVDSYDGMLNYREKNVCCTIKSLELMCALARFSPVAARGGTFNPFECPCCKYKPMN